MVLAKVDTLFYPSYTQGFCLPPYYPTLFTSLGFISLYTNGFVLMNQGINRLEMLQDLHPLIRSFILRGIAFQDFQQPVFSKRVEIWVDGAEVEVDLVHYPRLRGSFLACCEDLLYDLVFAPFLLHPIIVTDQRY
jgi:hypothetical protein